MKVQRFVYLLATLCATAGTAYACPTVSDLKSGVRISNTAGESETFIRLADGNTASRYRDATGFQSEAVLIDGVYTVTAYDIKRGRPDHDTLIQFVYDAKAAPLPEPRADLSWSGQVVYVENNRGRRETHSYSFGSQTSIRFGDCQYAMIPLSGQFGAQPEDRESYHYLPELGLSYLTESGTGANKLTYVYTQIDAVSD